MRVEVACTQTILGELCAAVHGREVIFLHTRESAESLFPGITLGSEREGRAVATLFEELHEYLQGERRTFSFVPRLPRAGSASNRVYSEVLKIPYGSVSTYGEIAEKSGTSPRAVGRILKGNRTLILIPCHRVIASRGWGGFALGLEKKLLLLKIEGAVKDKGE